MADRYFLGVDGVPESMTEVTRERFMSAEHAAGFRSKFRGSPATGGFGNGAVCGQVRAHLTTEHYRCPVVDPHGLGRCCWAAGHEGSYDHEFHLDDEA